MVFKLYIYHILSMYMENTVHKKHELIRINIDLDERIVEKIQAIADKEQRPRKLQIQIMLENLVNPNSVQSGN